jgi:hypothetical protein
MLVYPESLIALVIGIKIIKKYTLPVKDHHVPLYSTHRVLMMVYISRVALFEDVEGRAQL